MLLTAAIFMAVYSAFTASAETQSTDVSEKLVEIKKILIDVKERLENLENEKECTSSCPDRWMNYKGSCYYFGSSSVTFSEAQQVINKCVTCHGANGGMTSDKVFIFKILEENRPQVQTLELYAKSCALSTDEPVICTSLGGHLVHVETSVENVFLKNFMRSHSKNSFWVGVTDLAKEGVWRLTVKNVIASYFDWQTSEPNGRTGQNCVVFYPRHQYRWIDTTCSLKYRYLCERN